MTQIEFNTVGGSPSGEGNGLPQGNARLDVYGLTHPWLKSIDASGTITPGIGS